MHLLNPAQAAGRNSKLYNTIGTRISDKNKPSRGRHPKSEARRKKNRLTQSSFIPTQHFNRNLPNSPQGELARLIVNEG
jgi:hypothetical protein